MHHLAILNPKYHYLGRILDGTKSIESRWYKFRVTPWNRIKAGDEVYFKDAGKPVSAVATVSQILQFDHPGQEKITEIINLYGSQICAGTFDFQEFFDSVKDKNYIILVFLSDPQPVTPFNINKKGFGISSAWITINTIRQIAL